MSQRLLMLFREGTIKGEHIQTLGLSSGSLDTEPLGLVSSHKPSILAVSVPLMEQSITRMNCVLYLSICLSFWGTFSQCDFRCLKLAR